MSHRGSFEDLIEEKNDYEVSCILAPEKQYLSNRRRSYARSPMSPRSREKSPCRPQQNANHSGASETTILVENLGDLFRRNMGGENDGDTCDGTNSPTPETHYYQFESRPSLIRRRNTVQVMEPSVIDEPETCSLGETDSPRKDIKVQVCHDSQANLLYVTLIEAKYFVEDDVSIGPLNLYAQCSLLPHTRPSNIRKTEPEEGSNEPKWNQTMVYEGIAKHDMYHMYIIVSLWNIPPDQISGEEQFLGETAIDLAGAADEQERWYQLVECAKMPRKHHSNECIPTITRRQSEWEIRNKDLQLWSAEELARIKAAHHSHHHHHHKKPVVNGARPFKLVPTEASRYEVTNPLLPRGAHGIGGCAFGRYRSSQCPLS